MLLRAAIIGIALALPLGIAAGLIMRHHGSAPVPEVAAKQEAPAQKTAASATVSDVQIALPIANALPTASATATAEPAPLAGTPTHPSASSRPAASTPQAPARSDKPLAVMSGLDGDTPAPRKTLPLRSSQPNATKAAPVGSDHPPLHKLIYE